MILICVATVDLSNKITIIYDDNARYPKTNWKYVFERNGFSLTVSDIIHTQ